MSKVIHGPGEWFAMHKSLALAIRQFTYPELRLWLALCVLGDGRRSKIKASNAQLSDLAGLDRTSLRIARTNLGVLEGCGAIEYHPVAGSRRERYEYKMHFPITPSKADQADAAPNEPDTVLVRVDLSPILNQRARGFDVEGRRVEDAVKAAS